MKIKESAAKKAVETVNWKNAKIEIKNPGNPSLGRIVIQNKWEGSIADGKRNIVFASLFLPTPILVGRTPSPYLIPYIWDFKAKM